MKDNEMGAAMAIYEGAEEVMIRGISFSSSIPTAVLAEARGILLPLEKLDHTQRLIIHTDCQALLTNIDKLQSESLSIRERLKLKDHHLADQILKQAQRFTTPPKYCFIKGHQLENQGNNRAHEEATVGTNRTLKRPYYWTTGRYIKNYLHMDGEPIGQLASIFLKDQHIKTQVKATRDRLAKVWQIEDLDYDFSTSLGNMGLTVTNELDSSKYKEHSFRIKLLNKLLPTKDYIQKWKKYEDIDIHCARCLSERETYDHLLHCKETQSIHTNIIAETIRVMQEYKSKAIHFKTIREQPIENIYMELVKAIGLDQISFLETNKAKGIYTTQEVETIQTSIGSQHKEIYLKLVTSSYLAAIYNLVWKDRNDHTFA